MSTSKTPEQSDCNVLVYINPECTYYCNSKVYITILTLYMHSNALGEYYKLLKWLIGSQ